MTTMTEPISRFAWRRHHLLTTISMVLLFWLLAAVLVMAAHVALDAISPVVCAIAAFFAVLLAAFGYMRLVARQSDVGHALGVGIAWLVLAIVAEMIMTTRLGHGWFCLLGSPGTAFIRNVDLFVWIFAPALVARPERD